MHKDYFLTKCKFCFRSTEGWHVGLDFGSGLGNFTEPDEIIDNEELERPKPKPGPQKKGPKIMVKSGNMKLTSVSRSGRLWVGLKVTFGDLHRSDVLDETFLVTERV